MGYSTSFSGELLFTTEPKASELAELNKFLGEDCRQHPEWGNTSLSYIDLKLSKDFSGLEWDGSEKTYDFVDKVNLLIENMQKKYPHFGLSGELLAQGEEISDIWRLVVKNNIAEEVRVDLSHKKKVTCPHCSEDFFLEEEEEDNSKPYTTPQHFKNIEVDNSKPLNFIFSGFRNEYLFLKIIDKGYTVTETFSDKVTHLVMKDTDKQTNKKQLAVAQGCKIWNVKQLEDFLGY